jgi:hypothetical protein
LGGAVLCGLLALREWLTVEAGGEAFEEQFAGFVAVVGVGDGEEGLGAGADGEDGVFVGDVLAVVGLAPGVEKRQSAPGVETALLPDEDSLRRGVATK